LLILFSDVPNFTSELLKHSSPYKPLLPLLKPSSNPDEPTPLFASAVLSSLLAQALATSEKTSPQIDEALPQLYSSLSTFTKSSDAGLQDIAVQEYSALLRNKKSRQLFWKQRKETVDPLFDILRAAAGSGKDSDSTQWSGAGSMRTVDSGLSGGVGIQLLYHILLVIWQLSFEGETVGEGLQEYG
jgi:V-type H+-transporting ATPase subunit H